jgi:hypothetical protein
MAEYTIRKVSVNPFGADSYDVGEDESVLVAEPRGGNRIVVFIQTPVERCGVCDCRTDVDCEHGCCGGGGGA